MNKTLPLALIAALLTGCSNDPETESVAPHGSDDAASVEQVSDADPLELARTDPESLRQAMNDPEQREALIRSLRERRSRMGDDERMASREELRERMRERRADAEETDPRERLRDRQLMTAAAWWQNPDMAERLAISDTQSDQIEAAHQALEVDRQDARDAMVGAQRDLIQALQTGQRDQLEALLEQRSAAINRLNDAELRWQRALLATLDDDQLRMLARHQPQALIGRQRPN
jgi:hypothetical protein